jgi:nicotinamidase-related amidase
MADFRIDAKHSALLVMDFQTAIVERFAHAQDALLEATAAALDAARQAKMLVIYVVVGFRPGLPEVSARNQSFAALRARGGIAPDVHPRLAVQPGEIVVTKHRVGAFFATDLDMILRANEIDTLVLCGIATSGVVLSTLRHAADADYRIVVLRDCCSDADPEVHACLLNKVFPRQATVIESGSFLAALQPSA